MNPLVAKEYMELRLGSDVETTCRPTLPVLREESLGFSVSALQMLLTMRGFPCEVDGEFGPETASRLISFRASAGLSGETVADGALWEKILI